MIPHGPICAIGHILTAILAIGLIAVILGNLQVSWGLYTDHGDGGR